MSRSTRIAVIYRKELLDILRDRRTLAAMVLIPVVLYPIIMIGFVRLAESEEARLREQEFTVAVENEAAAGRIRAIIDEAHAAFDAEDRRHARFDVRVMDAAPEQLGDAVQLILRLRVEPPPARIEIEVVYNEINVLSRAARQAFNAVLDHFQDARRREALQRALGRPETNGHPVDVEMILNPVQISEVSAATETQRGGWALGQIVPIILVLMTITGAIYPAIDLTAGERERGTLETLMAAPVPILHLIIGKFLVVATIGLIAALLNVTCVAATMHLGGLTRALSHEMAVEIPYTVFPIILLCMVPFALLFAAVLLAVCSFARTFKEAQNYVTPVIICALIPAIGVTLPTVRLEGILIVVPVGNMVLLTRELFQQTHTWSQVAGVMISTTLYAVAAIALAARLFGREVVLFQDAGSYRTLIQRRYFRPAARPTASQALLLAAILFPLTFGVQSVLVGDATEDFIGALKRVAVVQFVGLFVLLPAAMAWYRRLDLLETFALRRPPARAWLAALLIGCSSWAVAHEVFRLQSHILPPSEALTRVFSELEAQLHAAPFWTVLVLLALVPAVCEELLFRGFLLSGVGTSLRKGSAILLVSVIFGVFHFFIERLPVTMMMGLALGYLCWQSRSVLPAIVAHAMHNGALPLISRSERVQDWLTVSGTGEAVEPLGYAVMIPAGVLFAGGLLIAATLRPGDITEGATGLPTATGSPPSVDTTAGQTR